MHATDVFHLKVPRPGFSFLSPTSFQIIKCRSSLLVLHLSSCRLTKKSGYSSLLQIDYFRDIREAWLIPAKLKMFMLYKPTGF